MNTQQKRAFLAYRTDSTVGITLELICAAKGPGGIVLTSDPECVAGVSFVGEFDLTVVAVP